MVGLKEQVISNLASLLLDVEALSCSILLLPNGSGLDRSSPKQDARCLQGSRAEKGKGLLAGGE